MYCGGNFILMRIMRGNLTLRRDRTQRETLGSLCYSVNATSQKTSLYYDLGFLKNKYKIISNAITTIIQNTYLLGGDCRSAPPSILLSHCCR